MNDVHREAFNSPFSSPFSLHPFPSKLILSQACTRSILSQRFTSLSLNTTRLPLNTPPTSPHVPILTSTNISTARRIILYVGEETQDLGIFAYRTIGHESLAAGSVQAFVSAVQSSPDELGVIIANPGQLLWYRRGCRAVTRSSWLALPRKNGVSDAFRIDPVKNRIPENEDMAAHVRYIFEHVITDMTTPDAQIDIIGLSEGAAETVEFLQANWDVWRNRIHAVAIGAGYAWPGSEIYNKDFAVFWAKVRHQSPPFFLHPQKTHPHSPLQSS